MEKRATTVFGFHGTCKECLASIESNGFKISNNHYDWLGPGIYFFQDAPSRAKEWAKEFKEKKKIKCRSAKILKCKGDSCESVVIGVQINLDDCMDLLDIEWYGVLSEAFDRYLSLCGVTILEVLEQNEKFHCLDYEIFERTFKALERDGKKINSVRAVFQEGSNVYENSYLFDKSHVQIAVRDAQVIANKWSE